jgi:GH15 family glucan-1,4-alpha-glucosidase
MYKKIGAYGIIGNLHSAALVGLDGSIDWLCLPHLDSPSVFGALLDHARGGRFSIHPLQEYDATASYLCETNVLVTRFRTRTGVFRVTDFMPAGEEAEETGGGRHRLYRFLEVEKGNVEVGMLFEPRFDYGRRQTDLQAQGSGIIARSGEESLDLSATHPVGVAEGRGEGKWHLTAGDEVCVHLRYDEAGPEPVDPRQTRKLLQETVEFWRTWLERGESSHLLEYGPSRAMVLRSLLALKLLFHAPSGSIAAAATTSLPEEIGGERNWDYRYSWVRDASMTVDALWRLGYREEMHDYLRWVQKIIAQGDRQGLRIMYRLDGSMPPKEQALSHWEGYKGSKPVRIGNAASRQRQLGIYGHLMEGARRLADSEDGVTEDLWNHLRSFCDHVIAQWREPDSSIWEIRGEPRHFLHTKLMCWVALKQASEIAGKYGLPADTELWENTMQEMRQEILERGWSERLQAFVQAYGAEELDASNLLIPMMGFLPFDDPKVLATVEALRRDLSANGFLFRYKAKDGLQGGEGVFLFCTLWLIINLARQGETAEAELLLRRVEETANHLGLFSEEYDPEWREQLGNTPQAFTHIGYLQAVSALDAARRKRTAGNETEEGFILNEEAGSSFRAEEVPERLASLLDQLGRRRQEGRMDYAFLQDPYFSGEWHCLERSLTGFDPSRLDGRKARTAFWVGVYNLLVLRGILDLRIQASVLEVGRFSRRVRYRVGNFALSPDEIEHGLLRGNRPPPWGVLPLLPPGDARLELSTGTLDPRIHFALFNGTASSAPPAPLHPYSLDNDLDKAASFLLGSGEWLKLDRENCILHLHRRFKWYAEDFGHSDEAGLRFLQPYLQQEGDREFLEEKAAVIRICYAPYDWRFTPF